MLSIYKASAGSGKTFTLTQRYIDFLFESNSMNRHRRILAVTFTKKATAEMKERIVRELAKLSNNEKSDYAEMLKNKYHLTDESLQQQAKQILDDILQDYSQFAVTTIDSFFQQIIRTFSRELGLPSSYNIELDDDVILESAIDDYFRTLPLNPHDEQMQLLLQLIDDNLENDRQWNPRAQIKSLCEQLLKEVYIEHEKELNVAFEDKEKFTSYIKWLKQIKSDYIADFKKISNSFFSALSGHDQSEFKQGVFRPFSFTFADIIKYISHDDKLASPTFFKFVQDSTACYNKTNKNADFALAAQLQLFAVDLSNLLQGPRSKDLLTAHLLLRYLPYLAVINKVSNIIEQTNMELNRLPMSRSNKLLADVVDQSDTPFVYDKTGSKISHFMIDEFQDTSSMQWHNFLPLLIESAGRGEENMIVGDTKQSIYRWRNSDLHLLQTKAQQDIRQYKEFPLDANWRSDKTIVEQNNRIFPLLAKKTAESFLSRNPNLQEEITDIYKDVGQIVKRNCETGYVKYFFSDIKKKEDRETDTLARLVTLLNDITQRGIPLGKVAILVRRNAEAALVAQWLISNSIKVMSSEGLVLNASPSVRIVIRIMQLSLNPQNEQLRIMLNIDLEKLNQTLSDDKLNSILLHLGTLPLQEQINYLVEQLNLVDSSSAIVFIDAFKDVVLQYSRLMPTDTYSFLLWWSENAEKCNVCMPQVDDSLSIVSVHRSKGLEYDVVIIPFYNWEVAENEAKRDNMLWVHTDDQKFSMDNRLPVMPLKFEKAMAYTCFKDNYFREVQDLYIDNLNISYVALTRAKRELYVFAPKVECANSRSNKVESGIKYVGGMLNQVLRENFAEDMIEDEGNQIWQYGEKVQQTKQQIQTVATDLPIIPPQAHGLNVEIRLPSRNYFFSDSANLSQTVNLGIVMHDLLSSIVTKDDVPQAIKQLTDKYPLTENELLIVEKELQQFFALIADRDWFSPEYEVLNEQDLVLVDGTMRRPDRLIIKQQHAIIIDYKFGFYETDDYQHQVSQYMSLLTQMGYQTEGYLCYVNLKKIVEVL